MALESAKADFVRVAKLQHPILAPAKHEFADLIERTVRLLVKSGKFRSIGAVLDAAVDGRYYYPAINDDGSLSRTAIRNLISLVDDPQLKQQFVEEARQAFLMRRARRQRSFSTVYELSPYEISWRRAITFKTISDPKDDDAMEQDYWSSLLYRMMNSLNEQLKPVDASNLGELR